MGFTYLLSQRHSAKEKKKGALESMSKICVVIGERMAGKKKWTSSVDGKSESRAARRDSRGRHSSDWLLCKGKWKD